MAAELITLPFRPVINTRGVLEPGALLDVFQSGTTTRVSVFSDAALTAPLSNPVVANASGVFPTVYFDNATAVRVRVRQANGSVLGDADPYYSDGLSSTDLSFLQSGSGAVTRTVQAKLRETVSVKDFGAVADGTTNDAPAFSAALDYLVSIGGGSLKVPSGTYRLTSQVAKTLNAEQSIRILGDGRNCTILDFSGAATLGLQFTSTTTTPHRKPQIEVADLSILTSRDNCGTAIRVSYANADQFPPSVTVQNVYIGGNITRASDSGTGFGYWTRGVYLTNARNSRIINMQFVGEKDKTPFTSHGVYLDGECTATQVIDGLLMEGATGIEATGTTEGVSVINCDVLYFRTGIYHNITSGGEPQLTVIGGSVNCANVNVWMKNSIGSVVSGVLMFAAAELDTGTWPEWKGVLVEGTNSRHNKVVGCTFTKNATRTGDTTIGIDFNQGAHCVAANNTFEGFSGNQLTFGVLVRSGFNQAHIADDNRFAQVSTPFIIDPAATRSFGPALRQSGITSAVTTGTTITFPQAFPSACDAVFLTHAGTNTGTIVTASSVSATGFTLNHNTGGSATFYWHAVGR